MRRVKKGKTRGGGIVGIVLMSVLAGVVLTLVAVTLYFAYGHPPVAATDKPALWEPLVQSVPLKARAHAEARRAPFPSSEDVFEAGSRVYRAQCSSCHGAPGHDSATGRAMTPRAQQFFNRVERHGKAADAPGEIYWKTAFGVRRSGMPAYRNTLSDTQLWQVSLLLHDAGGEIPEPVKAILTAGYPPPQPTVVQP